MPYGYSPVTHHPFGALRGGSRRPAARPSTDPADAPLPARCFVLVLDAARAGCRDAQAELSARGPSGRPRASVWPRPRP